MNLWCGNTHLGSLKQPYVKLNAKDMDEPTTVTTFLVATEKLIEKLEREHGGCLVAAEQAEQASRSAASSGTTGAPPRM